MSIGNQRWRDRKNTFRHPGEQFDPSEFDVEPIAEDTVARSFVQQHHYSGSYPAARQRIGLYRRGELMGVAVFSHPTNDALLTGSFPGLPTSAAAELGRFVLLDAVRFNGESWFIARCFDHLRTLGYGGIVSFSDPEPRQRADGSLVFPGHIGTIYQATNARYVGRGRKRILRVLPDGTVLNDRSVQKIRAGERGWLATAATLIRHGAPLLDAEADREARIAWLAETVAEFTRPLPHPGNHKYIWTLTKAAQSPLVGVPYPKKQQAA